MIAKLSERKEIAEGTVYLRFDTNEDVVFKAGQFFRLTLINPPYTDNRGNGRFLGFINTPSQNRVVEAIARKGVSAFKRWLVEMGVGSEVEIGNVGGAMSLSEDATKPLVVVTGGIGVVPFLSVLRTIKERQLEHKVMLIYSNTNRARTIGLDEIEGYAKENGNIKLVTTMTQDPDWGGEKRRIEVDFLREYLPKDGNFVCEVSGTPRFVPSVVGKLKEAGVGQEQIKFEVLSGY